MATRWIWGYDHNFRGPFATEDEALEDAFSFVKKEWSYDEEERESFMDDPNGWDIFLEPLDDPYNPVAPSAPSVIQYQWNSAGLIDSAKIEGGKGDGWAEGARNAVPQIYGPYKSREDAVMSREQWAGDMGFNVPDEKYFEKRSPIEEIQEQSSGPKFQWSTQGIIDRKLGRSSSCWKISDTEMNNPETRTFDTYEEAVSFRREWVNNHGCKGQGLPDKSLDKWAPITEVSGETNVKTKTVWRIADNLRNWNISPPDQTYDSESSAEDVRRKYFHDVAAAVWKQGFYEDDGVTLKKPYLDWLEEHVHLETVEIELSEIEAVPTSLAEYLDLLEKRNA